MFLVRTQWNSDQLTKNTEQISPSELVRFYCKGGGVFGRNRHCRHSVTLLLLDNLGANAAYTPNRMIRRIGSP
jgi:hypothetical protein